MKKLLSHLNSSIEEYSIILSLMKTMIDAKRPKKNDDLVSAGRKLLSRQNAQKKKDGILLKSLSSYSNITNNRTITTKVVEWIELQRQILDLNNMVISKLESIQSLITNELDQVKKGRSAIKGYQAVKLQGGKNINNAY